MVSAVFFEGFIFKVFFALIIIFYFPGVTVVVDAKAQMSLLGTEMDYVEGELSSEFVFHNPNIKGTCGCGESFNV